MTSLRRSANLALVNKRGVSHGAITDPAINGATS